jgi:hypothetical protein
MLDRLRSLVKRLQDIREVAALSDRDVADLGLSRDQVEAFVHLPRDVPERVSAMAAVFGVAERDLRAVHGEYLDILGTCGSCADRVDCGKALAEGRLKTPEDCGFCPNWATFNDKAQVAA